MPPDNTTGCCPAVVVTWSALRCSHMDRVYTIEEIKFIVAPIAAAHSVERIYLFGSYARGEATPSSDIDLRVDKGHLKGLIALGALYADLEDVLGKKLDLLTTGSLDQQFLQHISGEEILIYYCIQN